MDSWKHVPIHDLLHIRWLLASFRYNRRPWFRRVQHIFDNRHCRRRTQGTLFLRDLCLFPRCHDHSVRCLLYRQYTNQRRSVYYPCPSCSMLQLSFSFFLCCCTGKHKPRTPVPARRCGITPRGYIYRVVYADFDPALVGRFPNHAAAWRLVHHHPWSY